MDTGDVIEFSDGDGHIFGVITRDLGKKFIVTTEEGEEMRPSEEEVTYRFSGSIDTSTTDAIVRKLGDLREAVASACEEVDPEFLWEFVDGSSRMGADALAELFFDDAKIDKVMGLAEALRRDGIYFKQAGDGGAPDAPPLFEPRSSEHVEQLLEEKRAREREQRRRSDFIDGVREILEQPASERGAAAEERMEDTDFRHLVQLLQGYAIHDRDYGERDEALDLLNEVDETIGVNLEGQYGRRAFSLMVALGIWEEHENLWVHRYDLDGRLDDDVRDQLERLDGESWSPEPWREDLSGVTMFSIDDPSTMDIDDALSCEPRGDGPENGWEVGIHIADPSARIEKGSPLDEHARSRGTSIYLPTGNISMLPQSVSHDEASLVAGESRPALSVLAEFDGDGNLENWRVVPSLVEVDERLTYEQVDALVGEASSGEVDLSSIADRESVEAAVRALRTIAVRHREMREENGAIEIDLPDPELSIEWEDGEPQVDCRVKQGSTPARDLVGEFMILTNHLLGKYCRRADIPVVYRGQPPPDGDLNDDEIMSTPEGRARTFQRLYRLQPGRMTTEPTKHSGLGLSTYTQATSPIRRYADLVCQRQIKAHLADEPLPYDEDEMLEVLADIEEAGSEASRTQSESERYWILMYLKQRAERSDDPLEGEVIDHYNDDGTRGAVFVEEVAQKFSAQFREAVPVGETAELEVAHVDARSDELTLKG